MARALTKLAIISGPTGAGKSELAIRLAEALGGEIINADSLALYRGFTIGTAKPSPTDMARVPHHLIDVLNPDEAYDAAAYLRAARPLAESLWSAGRLPLAVGGTGFYLRSLTRGLFEGPGRNEYFRAHLAREGFSDAELHSQLANVDPESAAHLAPADRVRIERALEVFYASGKPISQWQKEHALAEKPFSKILVIIIDRPPLEMGARLWARTKQMFDGGLVEEVEALLKIWPQDLKPFKSIGYKETVSYLNGKMSLSEAMEKTYLATRQFAKRQRTWFRGQMPEAQWFHPDQFDDILRLLQNFTGFTGEA